MTRKLLTKSGEKSLYLDSNRFIDGNLFFIKIKESKGIEVEIALSERQVKKLINNLKEFL